jgi:hypothetical protein
LIIQARGEEWFKEKFLHVLTPVTITALLVTLVLLFSFKGEVIVANPLTILWIAIPLFIQTNLIFWLAYGLSRVLQLNYEDAAPSALIGARSSAGYGGGCAYRGAGNADVGQVLSEHQALVFRSSELTNTRKQACRTVTLFILRASQSR